MHGRYPSRAGTRRVVSLAQQLTLSSTGNGTLLDWVLDSSLACFKRKQPRAPKVIIFGRRVRGVRRAVSHGQVIRP